MTNLIETRKAEIAAQAEALRADIAANPTPMDEALAADKEAADLIGQIDKVAEMDDAAKADFRERMQDAMARSKRATDSYRLRDMEATLAADLVEIKTAYCISSDPHLTSPAGFHPDERVFVQPTICIHTDLDPRLPENKHLIPSSNMTLYFNEI